MLQDILDHLNTEFSGSEWGANGPLQLTKAMKKSCDDQIWTSEEGDNITLCKDVTVFKEKHFYPINWRQWPWMFKVNLEKIFSTGYFLAPYDTLSKFGNCFNLNNAGGTCCRRNVKTEQKLHCSPLGKQKSR